VLHRSVQSPRFLYPSLSLYCSLPLSIKLHRLSSKAMGIPSYRCSYCEERIKVSQAVLFSVQAIFSSFLTIRLLRMSGNAVGSANHILLVLIRHVQCSRTWPHRKSERLPFMKNSLSAVRPRERVRRQDTGKYMASNSKSSDEKLSSPVKPGFHGHNGHME